MLCFENYSLRDYVKTMFSEVVFVMSILADLVITMFPDVGFVTSGLAEWILLFTNPFLRNFLLIGSKNALLRTVVGKYRTVFTYSAAEDECRTSSKPVYIGVRRYSLKNEKLKQTGSLGSSEVKELQTAVLYYAFLPGL